MNLIYFQNQIIAYLQNIDRQEATFMNILGVVLLKLTVEPRYFKLWGEKKIVRISGDSKWPGQY